MLFQFRFGHAGISDMQSSAILLSESGSDPALPGKNAAQCRPAFLKTVTLESAAQDLNRLIGQHSDEQMPIGPILPVIVDWSQAQFRLETAEVRFQIGEHGIGPPQGVLIPVQLIGAQAVDPGMGQYRPGKRQLFPGQGRHLVAGFVRGYRYTLVLSDTVAFLLQPAKPLLLGCLRLGGYSAMIN